MLPRAWLQIQCETLSQEIKAESNRILSVLPRPVGVTTDMLVHVRTCAQTLKVEYLTEIPISVFYFALHLPSVTCGCLL